MLIPSQTATTRLFSLRLWLVGALFLGLLGPLQPKPAQATPPTKPKKTAQKTTKQAKPYQLYVLDHPRQMIPFLLRHKPQAIGFGEYHQLKKFRHITSSIERFTTQILPFLKHPPKTSELPQHLRKNFRKGQSIRFHKPLRDLLIETWITTGSCGKQEQVVVKEVTKVIQRPKKTRNHLVELILKAKKLKLLPHVLRIHCKLYEGLTQKDGSLHPTKFIRFVTDRLAHDCIKILAIRHKRKEFSSIVLYGGALHNDLNPPKTLAPFSYAARLKGKLHAPLLEVDLYVPEYIAADDDFRKEPWFPQILKNKGTSKLLLLHHPPYTYTLIFPWTKSKPPTKKK
ncbi:MAG: hypothetical protein H6728_04275 [Myxococcales bacterium]|nr:hypothetical protein [Myxococcales bacterium]MCB9642268.1 hypothetical protein [Myxococcales bacterium]